MKTNTKLIFKGFLLAVFTCMFVFSTNTTYAAYPGKTADAKKTSVISQLQKDIVSNQATLSVDQLQGTGSSLPMQSAGDDNTLLLVILAFLISPVAVYMYYDEWNSKVTVNLILWLLCGLPGLIHALVIILGKK